MYRLVVWVWLFRLCISFSQCSLRTTLAVRPHAAHLTPACFNPQASENVYTTLEFGGAEPHT